MSDALLPYYDRELNALRRLAGEFAAEHPKIAGRLRLAPDVVDDPHVARLLEGVAFLAARVHHRLDDEFPELTDALLGVLYPHYLAPVPSAAVMQFQSEPDLAQPLNIPAGIALETEPVHGEICRFRTSWPVTSWPIEIENVRLSGLPLAAPANPLATGAVSVLRVTLKCRSPDVDFARLGIDRLRFFIRGANNVALPLYELLCGRAVALAYADAPNDAAPVVLPATAIEPVGFAPEESLLPWPARSFSGFRLLTEYFALPEKFLFVDFTQLNGKTLLSASRRLEIFVYFDRALPELERSVNAESLALGCSPMINLFPQRCEPIQLTHTDTDYRIVPDARRPSAMEVWQVERVRESRSDGSTRPWRPFYRLTQADPDGQTPGGFYHLARRPTAEALTGSEVYLAPHDPEFEPQAAGGAVLSVDALCMNRDLPAGLPFGGGHPELRPIEASAGITQALCLTAPTAPLRPPLREHRFWRLVSHLSLGHLSVVGGAEGAAALREVLRLYDLRDSAETRDAIEALLGVSAAPGSARVPGGRAGAFCRGLDVTLEFDPSAWQSGGLYLLAAVLDRFLALHATVNSFVRTSAVLRGRPGRAAAWPARAGMRALL
ncbi:MAG: type VI secretion system baseplate subunit TssF [Alphaproteobacteria bacterium]|nr:type VI secretion system baseplate subunit TssF [Alphaproteobacteria bacterium]